MNKLIEAVKNIETNKIFNDIQKVFASKESETEDDQSVYKIKNLEYKVKEEIRMSSLYSEENLIYSGEVIATRNFDDQNGYVYTNIDKDKMKKARAEITNKNEPDNRKKRKNKF